MNAIVPTPREGEVLSPRDVMVVTAAMRPLTSEHDLVVVPVGSSVEEIVCLCGERCGISRLGKSCVVTIDGRPAPVEVWGGRRVLKSEHVVVRAVAGKGAGGILRSILSLALVVLATVVAGPAGLLAGTLGSLGLAAVGAGILIGGSLLINSLFPASQRKAETAKAVYSIASNRNESAKWSPIPVLLGKQRIAPKYASSPFTEFRGDDQYLTMLFVWGLGPMSITDIKIGDTALSDYDDVEVQTFNGYPTDGRQTLYPSEVVQDDFQLSLSSKAPPLSRAAAQNAARIVMDLVAPGGLIDYQNDGSSKSQGVSGEWRLINASTGTVLQRLPYELKAKTTAPLRRSFEFAGLDPKVSYKVENQKTSHDYAPGEGGRTSEVQWTAIKTYRAGDPPIEYGKPLAITALRIRASKQLNGVVDNLTAICTSRGKSWGGGQWTDNVETRSPADHFRMILQGSGNARPVSDDQIDLPGVQAWADFCRRFGWTFDMYRDFRASVRETLTDVCAAGRAVPIFRDGKWSVAMEDVSYPSVQHFTPRNSREFVWTPTYQDTLHAFRVKFVNSEKDYSEDETIIYNDGYDHTNATLFEQIELPGVTEPAAIYRHARYRLAERQLRSSTYKLTVDVEYIVCNRGDRVYVQHDVIEVGQTSGRIVAYDTGLARIDEPVTMQAGLEYGLKVRRANSGTWAILQVENNPGRQTEIVINGIVQPGDLWSFGLRGQETGTFRVLSIKPGDDLSADVYLVDDAPGITTADTGPIQGDQGTVVVTPPLATLRPRNLRLEQFLGSPGGVTIQTTRLLWDVPGGLMLDSFLVVVTGSEDDDIRQTVPGSACSTDFVNLDDGLLTFRVQGYTLDGRFTGFSEPLTLDQTLPRDDIGVTAADISRDVTDAIAFGRQDFRDHDELIRDLAASILDLSAASIVKDKDNYAKIVDVERASVERDKATAQKTIGVITKLTDVESKQAGISSSLLDLNSSVERNSQGVSANASALLGVTADVDGRFAGGQIRFQATVAPSGVTSRVAVLVRSGNADGFQECGLYIDILPNGLRQIVNLADRFVITDGGGKAQPFVWQNGVAKLGVGRFTSLTSDNGKLVIDGNGGSISIYD